MNTARLILGTAQIEPTYGVTRLASSQKADWDSIFVEAQSSGFSAVDTATLYQGAHATIGRSPWKGEIHTKLASMASVLDDFEIAKRDLRREEIDLVYFHRVPDSPEKLKIMRRCAASLKDQGAHSIGISVYSPPELDTILDVEDVSHVQIPLSALDQRFLGEPISVLKSLGKKIILRSVFLQGLLATNAPTDLFTDLPSGLSRYVAKFRAEADLQNLSFIECALTFIRNISGIHGVIIGCDAVSQVTEASLAWENTQNNVFDEESFAKLAVTDENLIDPRRW